MGSFIDASSAVTNKTYTANYADSFNKSTSTVTTQGDTGNTTLNIGMDQSPTWEKIMPLALIGLVLIGAMRFLLK